MISFLGILLVVAVIMIYFIPAWVASGKRQSSSVFLLNLFLGWTLLGWIAALIWAALDDPQQAQPTFITTSPKSKDSELIESLEKISALRNNGALSEDESQAQKKIILAKMSI